MSLLRKSVHGQLCIKGFSVGDWWVKLSMLILYKETTSCLGRQEQLIDAILAGEVNVSRYLDMIPRADRFQVCEGVVHTTRLTFFRVSTFANDQLAGLELP